MTSHAWKELVSTFILKYALHGLLGKRRRETLFFLFDVLARVCAKVIDSASLESLEYDIHKSLSLLEHDFPVSLHVSVFHLLHHVPVYLRRFGPVYSHWMYSFERFNSWIIRRVHNRRYPEATVIETYRLYDWAHHLKVSGQLPENALPYPTEPALSGDLIANSVHSSLNEAELAYLNKYYQESLPVYKDLCLRYEKEKGKAKTEHRLRRFPAMNSWLPACGLPLSSAEMEMREITKDMLRLSRFVRPDQFGKEIMFTSVSSDTCKVKSSLCFFS